MKIFVLISFISISIVSNLYCQTITYNNKYTYDSDSDLVIKKSGETYLFSRIQEIIFKDSMVWLTFYNKNNLIVSSFLKNDELEKIIVSINNNPFIMNANRANIAKIKYLILDSAIFENVYSKFESSQSYKEYTKLLIPNEKFYGFCTLAFSISTIVLLIDGYYLIPIIAIQPALLAIYLINSNFTSKKVYNRFLNNYQLNLIHLRDKIKKQTAN